MLFQMIQKDIDNADCSFVNCPLARCIKRVLNKSDSVIVTFSYCSINNVSYKLPDNAIDFREKFDNKQEIKLISFELSL